MNSAGEEQRVTNADIAHRTGINTNYEVSSERRKGDPYAVLKCNPSGEMGMGVKTLEKLGE